MYQKQLLEKWLTQIKSGAMNPAGLGLGSNREKAIQKLKDQINQLPQSKKPK